MKKQKHQIYIILFIVFTLIFGFVLACGEDVIPEKVEKLTEEEMITEEKIEETMEETPKTEIFEIGDTIKMGSLQFKVNSVRTSEGDEFFKPDESNVYLFVDITIENISNEEEHISSLLIFKIVDKDGRSYDMAIFADAKGSVDGSLAAGRKMTGELSYEVPKNINEFELEIDPELFGAGIAIVRIPIEK
ncbi:hypothetical protein ES703_13534 [subsurface metagenome]